MSILLGLCASTGALRAAETNTQKWTQALFEKLFQQPDPQSVAAAVEAIDSGQATPLQVAENTLTSVEYRAEIVRNYLATYLKLTPSHKDFYVDPAPKDAPFVQWLNVFTTGANEIDVLSGVLASAGYASERSFIEALYQDFLGVKPNADELRAWEAVSGD